MYELEHPWFLILLILPFLINRLPALPVEFSTALRVPFFFDFKHFDAKQKHEPNCLWFWHWIGIWSLLVFALAGPRWIGPPQAVVEETHNIMMVLDISGSMGLRDMPGGSKLVSRWSVVKKTAFDFIEKRPDDKLGVILFGERAYLFVPLTHDQKTLIEQIDDASVGLAGQATALGDAMGLAVSHLKKTPEKGRVMILLTDGVANAGVFRPLKAAQYALKEGIKIYTIGLGPDNNHTLSGLFWQMQNTTDLDEKSLKKIAAITNGQYFRATDTKSLNAIYEAIQRLEPVEQSRENVRPERLYFYIPLAIAWIWIVTLFGLQIFKDRSRI